MFSVYGCEHTYSIKYINLIYIYSLLLLYNRYWPHSKLYHTWKYRFHEVLQLTIIRQIMKKDEETEKYSQKPLELCKNLLVCLCVCMHVFVWVTVTWYCVWMCKWFFSVCRWEDCRMWECESVFMLFMVPTILRSFYVYWIRF